MRTSGRYDLVPNNTSVEKEMERIYSRQQLYQRVKELRRIQKGVNPNAWNETELAGAIVPQYLASEIKYTKKVVNEERRKARYQIYPGWDEMEPREQAQYAADGNIGELTGTYVNADDLEDLTDMEYNESDSAYMAKYISVWHEYCVVREYEQQVVDDIEWLLQNRPGAIREILERRYVQATIDYVYSDSADLTDLKLRHNNIVDFWSDMRAHYE